MLAYQVAGTEKTVAKSRTEGNFVEQLYCFDLYNAKYINCADCVGENKIVTENLLEAAEKPNPAEV